MRGNQSAHTPSMLRVFLRRWGRVVTRHIMNHHGQLWLAGIQRPLSVRGWLPCCFALLFLFVCPPPPLSLSRRYRKKDIHTNKYVTQYSVKYIFFLFWCIQIPITPWCVESPFRSCNLNYLLSMPSCLGVVFIFNTNSKLITLNKSIKLIWRQLKTEHEDSFKIGLDYLPTKKN